MISRQCLFVYLCFINPLFFRRRRRHGSPADGRRRGRASGGGVNGRQRPAARGCRGLPGGARAAGRGLPRPARSKGGTGQGKGQQRGRAPDVARADGRRRGLSACPMGAGKGRTGERGRADGKPPARGKGGACAVPLHGEALGKRKTPLAAGLVREGIDRPLFTGRGCPCRPTVGCYNPVNGIMQTV